MRRHLIAILTMSTWVASCNSKMAVNVAKGDRAGLARSTSSPTTETTTNVISTACSVPPSTPSVSFDTTTLSVPESIGQVSLTAALSTAAPTAIDVAYAVSGTASYPDDHDLHAGFIHFEACATTATLSFKVLDDAIPEFDETVIITLTGSTQVKIGLQSSAKITILNNDNFVPYKLSLTQSAVASSVVASSGATAFLSPDTNHIAYEVWGNAAYDLYVANWDLTNPVRVNEPYFTSNFSIGNVTFTPDSSKLIYSTSAGRFGEMAYYSQNLDGSGLTRLSPSSTNGAYNVYQVWALANSQYALFADTRLSGYGSVIDLFIAKLDGTSFTRLTTAANPLYCSTLGNCSVTISPDGSRLAYLSVSAVSGRYNLNVVNTDGSGRTLINDRVYASTSSPISFTSDSSKVVFVADKDTANLLELYVSPVSSASLTKLNGALVTGGSVQSFKLSPSDLIFFSACPTTAGHGVMHRVNIDGSGLLAITDDSVTTSMAITGYQFSSAGTNLYFLEQPAGAGQEIWSMPTNGTSAARISAATPQYTAIYMTLLADGLRIAYTTGNYSSGASTLVVMNIDGTSPHTLRTASNPLSVGSLRHVSSDGRYFVLYGAQLTAGNSIYTFVDSTNGSTPVPLTSLLPAGCTTVYNNATLRHGDDFYVSAYSCGTSNLMYKHTIGVAGATLMTPTAPNFYPKDVRQIQMSFDGQKVVYNDAESSYYNGRVYAANLDGSGTIPISRVPFPGGNVAFFAVVPKAGVNRVVYGGEIETAVVDELFATSLDGTNDIKLHPAGSWGLDLTQAGFDTAHDRIVFSTDGTTSLCGSIMCSASYIDGSGLAGLDTVSGYMGVNSIVHSEDFRHTTDSSYLEAVDVDYAHTGTTDGIVVYGSYVASVYQLYKTSTSANSPVALVSTFPSGAAGVQGQSVTPNGSTVVFIADYTTAGVTELYSIPVSGGTPVKLNGALAVSTKVSDFRVIPDGQHVVYSTFTTGALYRDLFIVKIDGTARKHIGTTALNTLPYSSANSGFLAYKEVPDANGVSNVYVYDVTNDQKIQMSSSVTGASPTAYRFTHDSKYLIYYGKLSIDANEIWLAAVDGSSNKKITTNVQSGLGTLSNYVEFADGSKIFYVKADATSGLFTLYCYDIASDDTMKMYELGDVKKYISYLTLTSDNKHLLATGSIDTEGVQELYRIDLP